MPLPELFKAHEVAAHLGVSVETVDREARRLGTYVRAGRHMLLTSDDINGLLAAWHPAPEAPRLVERPTASDERPFTPESLAREWNVSAQHIRNLIRQGELGHFRLGRLIRISAASARTYQETHMVKS
jgi:excisionase family DNA binding protein